MNYRIAEVADVPRMVPLAQLFFDEGAIPGKLSPEHFVANLTMLLEQGLGLYILAEENGEVVGGIGGVITPDLLTGDVTANEIFWFCHPEHRGCGLRLLNLFEEESTRRGAVRVHMVHLINYCSDRLDRLFERRGYRLVEKAFTLELLPNHIK
jgi:hypothetical protein